VLQMARRALCSHVAILPEAASIVFGGGFPRHPGRVGRRAAQRAIFHVQKQVETLVAEEGGSALGLCDRGTVDGLAYWPGDPEDYWREVGSSLEAEIARYATVIHMRTPPAELGYNGNEGLRIESAVDAAAIDARIVDAWSTHPHRHVIESTADFLDKTIQALSVLRDELPGCCAHRPPSDGGHA
jgi:hypothetical protein